MITWTIICDVIRCHQAAEREVDVEGGHDGRKDAAHDQREIQSSWKFSDTCMVNCTLISCWHQTKRRHWLNIKLILCNYVAILWYKYRVIW